MAPLKILFSSSEVAPFAKTGGLADVAGSLPAELGRLGAEVLVTMPRYRGVPEGVVEIAPGARVAFLDNEEFFNRSALYGNEHGDYPDNLRRFSYFCTASLEKAKELQFRPDIAHMHDWQTALVPVLLKTRLASDEFFSRTRSILTIHNLAYQGHFPARQFAELGLDPALYSIDGFEFYGRMNLLKAGLVFADALSTVSPTYAKEIQTAHFGFGLDGVIRERADKLRGILNGIDTRDWDPATDKALAAAYSAGDVSGKAACKADLQRTAGLDQDAAAPVFGIVSRLAAQKGLDLLSDAVDGFIAKGVQFVLLGDGDAVYKTTFQNVARRHPGRASANIGFSAAEARKVYAGSDFFLMPSLFEPCGLGQMIALRYGTLPIVRKTGGLADTIVDADENPAEGNGFAFSESGPGGLAKAADRALALYKDKLRFEELRKRGMKQDFSWKKSAGEYVEFYRTVADGAMKRAAA